LKIEENLLKKYADVLINFALNSGEGLKKGEIVLLMVPDVAKPLLKELNIAVLRAGGQPIIRLLPTGIDRDTYQNASDEQLKFFPKKYTKALIDMIDHQVSILADTDLKELEGIAPEKILLMLNSKKEVRKWTEDKEYRGKFTWTIGLYPTKAMADEAGLTMEEYWNEIVRACFLDLDNPIVKWKKILEEQEKIKNKLDKMPIKLLQVKGKNIDLGIAFGDKRKWLGGGGRNVPSFEIFTSPDWRGTNGKVSFDQPLFMYGNKIKGISLEFKDGKVVKAYAERGQDILEKMISQKNADKVGEFSLTDKRFSRISKFMANTLFDENIGGKYGNMHIALGLAYKEAYTGNVQAMKAADWKKLGFNQSPEHKDIINTQDKTVTAVLKSGKKKVIYSDGQFRV
jgi:aminopeptidase